MKEPVDVHKIFAQYFKGCETLAYALSERLGEGNICLDIKEYKTELPQRLEEQKVKESFNEVDSIYWAEPTDFLMQCKDGLYVTHSPVELKPYTATTEIYTLSLHDALPI